MFKTSMTRLLLRIGRCNDTVSPDFTGKSEILSLLDSSTVDPISEQVMDCLTYWANVIHNILSNFLLSVKFPKPRKPILFFFYNFLQSVHPMTSCDNMEDDARVTKLPARCCQLATMCIAQQSMNRM